MSPLHRQTWGQLVAPRNHRHRRLQSTLDHRLRATRRRCRPRPAPPRWTRSRRTAPATGTWAIVSKQTLAPQSTTWAEVSGLCSSRFLFRSCVVSTETTCSSLFVVLLLEAVVGGGGGRRLCDLVAGDHVTTGRKGGIPTHRADVETAFGTDGRRRCRLFISSIGLFSGLVGSVAELEGCPIFETSSSRADPAS